MPTLAFLAILALVLILGFVIVRVDGLALFAPKRTRRIAGPAHTFCVKGCRLADGECPLADVLHERQECPLWRFIEADVPTNLHGSPFARLDTVV